MAGVVIEFSSKDEKILASYQRIEAENRKFDQQLKELGQTGDRAGALIGESLAQAAKKPDFNTVLADLRRLGPVGRQVAGELNMHFGETGKAGRKTFEEIIETLRKLDPESAAIARRVQQNINRETKHGFTNLIGSFGGIKNAGVSIGREISGIVAGVVSVNAGISAVRAFLEEERKRGESAAAARLTVAEAQASVLPNMMSMTEGQRTAGFARAKALAAKTGVPEQVIIRAVFGAGWSASGGDIEKAFAAAETAAALNRLDQEMVGPTTSSMLDIGQATGASPQANLGAMVKMQEEARPDELSGIVKIAAPVASSAVLQFKGNRTRVVQESLGLAAATTQAVKDAMGAESAQNTQSVMSAASNFITKLPDEIQKSRDTITRLEEKVRTGSASLLDSKERKELSTLKTALDPQAIAAAREELKSLDAIDEASYETVRGPGGRKIRRRDPTKGLTDVQAERRAVLQDALAQERQFSDQSMRAAAQKRLSEIESKASAQVLDQQELRQLNEEKQFILETERLSRMQTDSPLMAVRSISALPGVKRKFSEREFGEQKFKGYNAALFTFDSPEQRAALATSQRITLDEARGTELLNATQFGTRELKQSNLMASGAAGDFGFDRDQVEKSHLANVRKLYNEAMGRVVAGDATATTLFTAIPTSFQLSGSTASEEALSAIEQLLQKKVKIHSDGIVDAGEQRMLDYIDEKVGKLQDELGLIMQDAESGMTDVSPDSLRLGVNRARGAGSWESTKSKLRNPNSAAVSSENVALFQMLADRLEKSFERIIEQQNKILEKSAEANQETAANLKPNPYARGIRNGAAAATAYGAAQQ